MQTYTVQPGDTLSAIARRNGLTWQELQSLNDLANPNLIRPGDEIRVPSGSEGDGETLEGVRGPGGVYTVQRGDTLSEIAEENDTTWQELARINELSNPNRLSVGQTIRLSPAPPREPLRYEADVAVMPQGPMPQPRPTPPGQQPRPSGPPLPTGNPNRAYNPQAAANEIELDFMRREQAKGNDLYATGWRPSYTPGYEVPSPPPGQFNIPPQMAANARAEPQQAGGIDYGSLSKPELDNIFGRMNLAQLNQVSVDRLTSPLALRTFSEHLERARRLEASLLATYQQGANRAQGNFNAIPVMTQPVAPMGGPTAPANPMAAGLGVMAAIPPGAPRPVTSQYSGPSTTVLSGGPGGLVEQVRYGSGAPAPATPFNLAVNPPRLSGVR